MIIVTGGAGFIGSNIVKALNDKADAKQIKCGLNLAVFSVFSMQCHKNDIGHLA